jgi:hypothetical protein
MWGTEVLQTNDLCREGRRPRSGRSRVAVGVRGCGGCGGVEEEEEVVEEVGGGGGRSSSPTR